MSEPAGYFTDPGIPADVEHDLAAANADADRAAADLNAIERVNALGFIADAIGAVDDARESIPLDLTDDEMREMADYGATLTESLKSYVMVLANRGEHADEPVGDALWGLAAAARALRKAAVEGRCGSSITHQSGAVVRCLRPAGHTDHFAPAAGHWTDDDDRTVQP